MVTACGVVTVDGKEVEQSKLQLLKVFGRGRGFCVCACGRRVSKLFRIRIYVCGDLIGSFSARVGLP